MLQANPAERSSTIMCSDTMFMGCGALNMICCSRISPLRPTLPPFTTPKVQKRLLHMNSTRPIVASPCEVRRFQASDKKRGAKIQDASDRSRFGLCDSRVACVSRLRVPNPVPACTKLCVRMCAWRPCNLEFQLGWNCADRMTSAADGGLSDAS